MIVVIGGRTKLSETREPRMASKAQTGRGAVGEASGEEQGGPLHPSSRQGDGLVMPCQGFQSLF